MANKLSKSAIEHIKALASGAYMGPFLEQPGQGNVLNSLLKRGLIEVVTHPNEGLVYDRRGKARDPERYNCEKYALTSKGLKVAKAN